MTFGIAAAGTGGHVFPALAVAEVLAGWGMEVVFFGGDRLESDLVPAAGYPLVRLEVRGLRRAPSPSNLALPAVVLRAARRAGEELAGRDVRVVLGMGGYVTGPLAWAARRRGVPLVLHEQNARPGLANRLAARWARRVLVAFPAAARRLPRAEVVGNPIRDELAAFSREQLRPEAIRRYRLASDVPTLGVLGGSLGAGALNRAVTDLVEGWDGPPFQVVHVAGRAHAEEVSRRASAARLPWRVLPFESEMPAFYAAADLVLCRAGASTIAELAATGTPSVLVPPGQLGRLGQDANAAHLGEVGAAELLPEAELSRLPEVVGRLLGDPERRERMGRAARSVARPDAALRVAEVLREVAGG